MPINTYNCAFEDDVDAEFDWDDAFQCECEHAVGAAEEFASAEAEGSDEVVLVRDKKNGVIFRCCVELAYTVYAITKVNQGQDNA